MVEFRKRVFEPIFGDTTKIFPALGFTEDNIYVNLWLDARDVETNDITIIPYWLSDNTLLDRNTLTSRGIILLSRPDIIKDRISMKLVKMLLERKIEDGRDNENPALPISTSLPKNDENNEKIQSHFDNENQVEINPEFSKNYKKENNIINQDIKSAPEINDNSILVDVGRSGRAYSVRPMFYKSTYNNDTVYACIISTKPTNLYQMPKSIKMLVDAENEFNDIIKAHTLSLPISTSLPKLIFKLIKNRLDFYFEFPDDYTSSYLALWIIGTYFFPLFRSFNYIYVHGAKASGKSNLLSVLEKVCFNARYSTEITPQTAYRVISQTQCTLLIDETDEFASVRNKPELMNILRSGYKNGVLIPRQFQRSDRIGDLTTVYFNGYCPKVMANITGIEDVLLDRAVRIVMQRAVNPIYGERSEYIDTDNSWSYLRDMLYIYLLYFWKDVKTTYLTTVKPENINNRSWELWRPLLSFAKIIGDEVYDDMIKFADIKIRQKQTEEVADERDNLTVQALFELVSVDGWYKLSEIRESFLNQSENLDPDKNPSRYIARNLIKLGYLNKRIVHGKTEFFISRNQVELDLTKRFRSDMKWLKLPMTIEEIIDFMTTEITESPKSIVEIEKAFCDRFNIEMDSNEIEIFWDIKNKFKDMNCLTENEDKVCFLIKPSEENLDEISNCYHIVLTTKERKKIVDEILDLVADETDVQTLKKKLVKLGFEEEKIDKTLEAMQKEGKLFCPKIGVIKKVF